VATVRIHHLNCISTCPLGGRLTDGISDCLLCRARLSCHCLLAETEAGLVLVDTGLGLRDVRDPRKRLSGFFLSLLSPDFREDMTAVRQVEALGYSAKDVRHIVLTHLDFDHAGGLDDFPQATVHLMRAERDYAHLQKTWLDRQRFRPQQWSTQSRWRTYEALSGERWFGFDCVRSLRGLPPEVLMVPLPGHTFGHAGVAVQDGERWLLLAGDAYFHPGELDERPRCPPGLRLYQTLMEKSRTARLLNQQRLRALHQQFGKDVVICCSHAMPEFEAMSAQARGTAPQVAVAAMR
jgi:glyoxylase-like metal-dependent hydrolase (beta-lactamase superfamily II)